MSPTRVRRARIFAILAFSSLLALGAAGGAAPPLGSVTVVSKDGLMTPDLRLGDGLIFSDKIRINGSDGGSNTDQIVVRAVDANSYPFVYLQENGAPSDGELGLAVAPNGIHDGDGDYLGVEFLYAHIADVFRIFITADGNEIPRDFEIRAEDDLYGNHLLTKWHLLDPPTGAWVVEFFQPVHLVQTDTGLQGYPSENLIFTSNAWNQASGTLQQNITIRAEGGVADGYGPNRLAVRNHDGTEIAAFSGSNRSFLVGTTKENGTSAGDIMLGNSGTYRFLNGADATGENFGITGTSSDNMLFQVPGAGDSFSWYIGTEAQMTLDQSNDTARLRFANAAGSSFIASLEPGANGELASGRGTLGVKVATPSTAADACKLGDWAEDDSYLYVCIADGSWKRAALAAW